MAKALLFGGNSTPQTLTGGGIVNLGTAIHGFGCTCCQKTIDLTSGGIVLREGGYYDVTFSVVVTNSEAGNVTLTLYQDGVASAVITGSEAIAAADDPASITISGAVLVPRCGTSTLTVVATASAGNPTVNSISDKVVKL